MHAIILMLINTVPGHGRQIRIAIGQRNVVKGQAVLKECLTYKKFAESEVFYEIVYFFLLDKLAVKRWFCNPPTGDDLRL